MTLAELEALRAALPDDAALPATATREELSAHQHRRVTLDRRIRQAQQAQATLATLHVPDPLWQEHLEAWREVLCAELLALPARIRDPKLLGVQANLTLSIKTIDFGPDVLEQSDYDLTTLRLGQLMRESGYEPVGADPRVNYSGVMPWHGSLRDAERSAKDIEHRRAQAQEELDDALLDDDARAKRDADAAARIAALNAQPVLKTRADGSQYLKYPDGRREEVESSAEVETSSEVTSSSEVTRV